MTDQQAEHRLGDMARTVDELVQKAVQNERILRRYQQFELTLVGTDGLESLLECLVVQSRHHFQLDVVTLWLLDTQAAARSLLSAEQREVAGVRWLENAAELEQLFPDAGVRLLTPVPAGLFADRPVRSAALLPLVRHGRLIGSLHFGSFAAQRFTQDKSTDFIGHLGSIAALCLESALDRERLHRLSLVDALTQIGNRRAFELALERELARARRSREPVTVMMADLDHFKTVNDQHGHPVGDRVLRRVAAEISTVLRRTDHVCRCGGEEFALILPDCGRSLAEEVAERIRDRIARLSISSDTGIGLSVTLSIGLTCWQPANDLADVGSRLVRTADRALYRAKRAGRNRAVFDGIADEQRTRTVP